MPKPKNIYRSMMVSAIDIGLSMSRIRMAISRSMFLAFETHNQALRFYRRNEEHIWQSLEHKAGERDQQPIEYMATWKEIQGLKTARQLKITLACFALCEVSRWLDLKKD